MSYNFKHTRQRAEDELLATKLELAKLELDQLSGRLSDRQILSMIFEDEEQFKQNEKTTVQSN